jgi:Flp pilus assembly protein protease CpaA
MDWNWVGETTASSHLCGFALGFAVVFAVYLFSGFGGGDVKLVGVVGLCVGFPRILECLLWTYGLASGLTLAYVLVRYGVRATATGSLAGPRAAGAAGAVGRIRIPMAPFFLLGCAVESFRDRLL